VAFPGRGRGLFDEVARRRYPFHLIYGTEDYLTILAIRKETG
jgi:hypothetical protein